jgi:hypothetical protein
MMEQASDDERGWRAMEWTRDARQQQINNQPLMGVAKVGRDRAVKAVAAMVGMGCSAATLTMAVVEKLAPMAWQG